MNCAMHVRSVAILFASFALPAQGAPPADATHVPPASGWEHCTPAAAGMDPAKLAAAIAFAQAHPTDWPADFSTQEQQFGKLLGPIPKTRAGTNGVIVRHGYVVAEFGDTSAVDPTYSVAKSMLSTVAAIAVREHKVDDLDEPVGARVHDGGYDGAQNAAVTWRQHLQQESEWQGAMWGKNADFVGRDAFGQGEHKPRALQPPGSHYEYNDVGINRLALSLLAVFGRAVPDVFRDEVMAKVGASDSWKWIPYDNAFVELAGARVPSVSGGTRWGGGVWISSLDLARFGLLWLRGGCWGDRQILPADYVAAALRPSAHGPDYGFLWWLDTRQQNWPGLPANAFGARGAGNNTVFCSPDHDLVIVWRWHSGSDHADAQFFARVIDAIAPARGPQEPSPRAGQPTAMLRDDDGHLFEGRLTTPTLVFTVDGVARPVPVADVLSLQFGAPANEREAARIDKALAALGGADGKAVEAAAEELADIGLPVLTPLLRSYVDTDAHEPDLRYRLFARIVPAGADDRDRTLDLLRLADGEVLRGRLAPIDLRLEPPLRAPATFPSARLRTLAIRRARVERTFELQALHDCTYVGFVDTGVLVTPTTRLLADATGFVRLSFDEDGWAADPDGIKEPLPGKRKLQEGFRWGAVLGRVGAGGERWFAGRHVDKQELGRGRLYFVVNDNEHWQNNVGSYRVRLVATDAYDLGDPR
jgi:CubicO group peptidase (beta-lactamase class C family)